ncbi:AbrB/MazE/SpoVT family DNA-binding domain-containing protein [Fenollaria massiliensis]|uniref:AbrB/MazE/SpoVT family DNA-binding domain-containing protein n=1 Tax=Fenollaria massiliensis TaxID=938288 RepID=A0A9E7DJK3_9FIRM|nr:AbrB/MazE/SpoVT family DNA-binding domain-containing protein [Fenollaria massiliensis]UQK59041.1 AbrB/MazE/SpoVT family DNA-binding domain-containing protein [Fenollaria massiliensis]
MKIVEKLDDGFLKIPNNIIDEIGWKTNDELNIQICADKLVLEKRKNIKDLFDGYDGKYNPEEFDWGEAEGKEIF